MKTKLIYQIITYDTIKAGYTVESVALSKAYKVRQMKYEGTVIDVKLFEPIFRNIEAAKAFIKLHKSIDCERVIYEEEAS